MWLLFRLTHEYTVGNNLFPFLFSCPLENNRVMKKARLKKKKKGSFIMCYLQIHRDMRRAILRSDIKCHFKDKKGI